MSRLVSIALENFMSLPKAELVFDERGIIAPVGYNDSGKSAITRSCEVLWYDSYSTEQVRFITDGEDHFTITQTFDDGVVISRTKFANGTNLWEMTNNGAVVYTNRLDNGKFAATKGVPEAIQAYLQVSKDSITKELLNIRRNTNKLLLVETSGGDNYKFINNQAQGERLAYASSALNQDLNAINRELAANSAKLSGLNEAYGQLEVFDERLEQEIAKRASELQATEQRLNALCVIAEKLSAFNDKVVREELPLIDTGEYELLQRLATCAAQLSKGVIDDLPVVDTRQLEMLQGIIAASADIKKSVVDDIPTIDTAKLEALQKLQKALDAVENSEYILGQQEDEYRVLRDELAAIANEQGWRICKNCGEVVEYGDHEHAV